MKRERKFLYRVVFSYTIVFSVVFLIIMGLLYVILAANLREEARLNNQMLVTQPLKQLDRFFSEMDNVAYKAMTSETLIQKFSVLRDENNPANHYDADMLDNIDTATVLTGINGRLDPMRRISVYNDKGDFIFSGSIVDKNRARENLQTRDVSGMMRRFAESGVDYTLSHPQRDVWCEYFQKEYFTLTRPIMNVYSRDVVGIVEVQRNRDILDEYLRLSPDKGLALNIYDETGNPVMINGGDGYAVAATAVSDAYGWTIELLEPKSAVRGEMTRLMGTMALAWLLLCAVVFVVINLIAAKVAKPLTDLTAEVRGISAADPQKIHVDSMGIGEIVSLEAAFNQMLESLTLSMDQEKKSFLLAMQAQMNPHFLYNVLSVINAEALEGHNEKIVRICGNLSGLLRYASSFVQGSATVSEELGHTKSYLEIMKARYDYMFGYTAEMDETLAGVTIPKLVIQPLCENCFTHGFSNLEPPYNIGINILRFSGGWMIRITDNGTGFDEETRLKILERANNASYEDLNKMQLGGLGLVSSVVRLKLFTGCRVVCGIESGGKTGNVVEIRIFTENGVDGEAVL